VDDPAEGELPPPCMHLLPPTLTPSPAPAPQDSPADYVLATGEMHTVREFVEKSFAHIGQRIQWRGAGTEEVGFVADAEGGAERVVVRIDAKYFRPTEVEQLLGNAAKAKRELGWEPKVLFEDLVKEMVDADIALVASGDVHS
jgi:GDPmannose 4,6-dehydratase